MVSGDEGLPTLSIDMNDDQDEDLKAREEVRRKE
jgi:hypothetical protein